MPIKDAQIEVATDLALAKGLHLEGDGPIPPDDVELAWRFTRARLYWSPGILWWVVPTGRALPSALRPTRTRARTLDTPEADSAAALWHAWAPGPSSRQRSDTEQIQRVPLTGRWAAKRLGLAIDYLSDKFNPTRTRVPYRHKFDTPPKVEVMSGKGYEVWVVKGPELRITERGIEG